MKLFLVFFQIFAFGYWSVNCDDGFLTLWAPKHVSEAKPLRVTYIPKNLESEISAAFQFRDSTFQLNLQNDKFTTVTFENTKLLSFRSEMELIMTLHKSLNQVHMCSTSTISLKPEQRNFYVFIQLDKPIYKPGDDVKFRILVIDRDMKPFHMNNLKVDIKNPFGQNIKSFEDIEHQYLGVFEQVFKLTSNTFLGDWKLRAVVDNKEHYGVEKIFQVDKYVLPLFDVQIETSDKHYQLDSELTISFYAKYSFGEFVSGNAKLIIRNSVNKQIYLTKLFRDVKDVVVEKYSIANDLRLQVTDQVELEAIVTFMELESDTSASKSKEFYVHGTKKYQIRPVHPKNFMPGSIFTIKVFISNWKNEKITSNNDKMELEYTFGLSNFQQTGKIVFVEVIDGIAKYELNVSKNTKTFYLKIKFGNSNEYRKKIEIGSETAGIIVLDVNHSPQNPKLNDLVKITVTSDSKMDKILPIVTTKLGSLERQEVVDCYNQMTCNFDVVMSQDMMPYSTVTVYHVVDKLQIYQGSTKIKSQGLSANHLDFTISASQVKVKEKAHMRFSTSAKSKIYLLAFDKSLTFLRDGNDISSDEVSSAVADYDANNQILVNDLSFWYQCKDDELKRLNISIQKTEIFKIHRFSVNSYPSKPFSIKFDNDVDSNLRHDFPESWIFESIEMGNQMTILKDFPVPDTITTWIVSAFSVHNEHGLAMAPAQELTVKNDFFVKLNLPYSIKFKEVLKLDILVYNYINSNEQMNVNVELHNLINGQAFEFVEYTKVHGSCTASYNSKFMSKKSVVVPHLSVKRVSFYIRSHSPSNEFVEKNQKMIRIHVKAFGTTKSGKVYQDMIQKDLLVDPIGVRDYIIRTMDQVLDGSPYSHLHQANFTDDLAGINVIVAGDYLTDTMKMTSRFELFPYDCLEQRTSKLKGNVEYFRYRLAFEKNPSTEHFSDFYQNLLVQRTKSWSYSANSGYRAYFLDAVASAMEIGALSKDLQILRNELNQLNNDQRNNGNFVNFGNFYGPNSDLNDDAKSYYHTAYVLIPFLKIRTFMERYYENTIKEAFNYLNSKENLFYLNKEGLSIAAYAFALNKNYSKAKDLLDHIEELKIDYGNNKKCYKIRKSDKKCELRHTSYAALAYIAIQENHKALPLVNWMLNDLNLNNYYSNTHDYALAMEPIARLAEYLKTDNTQLIVTLKNEHNFEKSIKITKTTSKDPQYVEFPSYSSNVMTTASGYGYCSITTIFERIILLPRLLEKFSLNANVISQNSREKIVKICATYRKKHFSDRPTLLNVIYEVEMPSGYVYGGVVNLEMKRKDMKLVTERKQGTLVYIYYNDYEVDKEYCVEIKALKSFEVNEIKSSGVKIYDYSDKENTSIIFYKISNTEC